MLAELPSLPGFLPDLRETCSRTQALRTLLAKLFRIIIRFSLDSSSDSHWSLSSPSLPLHRRCSTSLPALFFSATASIQPLTFIVSSLLPLCKIVIVVVVVVRGFIRDPDSRSPTDALTGNDSMQCPQLSASQIIHNFAT